MREGSMAAKPVGWGMIGTRGWSDMILGPAVNAARGARFKAVLSTGQESAERYCASHGVARGYTDIGAFLADDAVDAVWIASPNHLHKAQAIAALKAGKHVLCEKPMAMDAAECRAMIRAAKKGRPPAHRRLQQPPPPAAERAPRAVAGGPLRRAGADARPVPLPLSARAGRLVAARRRDLGLLGAGRCRHPLHRPAALVQRRGEDGCTPISPTRPTGAPPIMPSSPSASGTAPSAPSRRRSPSPSAAASSSWAARVTAASRAASSAFPAA